MIMAHVVIPACNDESSIVRSLFRAMISEDTLIGTSISTKGCRTYSTDESSPNEEHETECTFLGESLYDSLGKCLIGQWDVKYQCLLRYVAEFHKIPVRTIIYENITLGEWINVQRRNMRKNDVCMTPDRINRLNSVSGWEWNKREQTCSWDEMFDRLKRYTKIYKIIPTQKTEFEKYKLGYWINNQRMKKNKNAMPADHIIKLGSIPEWSWSSHLEDNWNTKYELLIQYVNQYDLLPPIRETYKNVNLGYWVHRLRGVRVGNHRGTLTPDRIAKLESIPHWYW